MRVRVRACVGGGHGRQRVEGSGTHAGGRAAAGNHACCGMRASAGRVCLPLAARTRAPVDDDDLWAQRVHDSGAQRARLLAGCLEVFQPPDVHLLRREQPHTQCRVSVGEPQPWPDRSYRCRRAVPAFPRHPQRNATAADAARTGRLVEKRQSAMGPRWRRQHNRMQRPHQPPAASHPSCFSPHQRS
jgi:hypothetical protein